MRATRSTGRSPTAANTPAREPSEGLRLLAIDPPYGPRAYEPDGVTVTQGKFCVREDGVVIFRSDYEGWPH